MKQNFIAEMTGYKATNADLKCQEFQFEIGKWHEIEGEIALCKRGFHFCVQPSGPWCYYRDAGTRIFKIEAEQVLELPIEAGADFKLVAKRIRLVEEITPGGNSNTGDSNTGHSNTGNWNTGHGNTGDSNTGHRNTGNWNTGHSNTGHSNTGHSNTGNSNTGNSNTGHRNTGNWNTGSWNTGNFSAGFFCSKEPRVISFDVQTEMTREKFLEKYPESHRLGELLRGQAPIKIAEFKRIPGITAKKLDVLHKTYLSKLPKDNQPQETEKS